MGLSDVLCPGTVGVRNSDAGRFPGSATARGLSEEWPIQLLEFRLDNSRSGSRDSEEDLGLRVEASGLPSEIHLPQIKLVNSRSGSRFIRGGPGTVRKQGLAALFFGPGSRLVRGGTDTGSLESHHYGLTAPLS